MNNREPESAENEIEAKDCLTMNRKAIPSENAWRVGERRRRTRKRPREERRLHSE